MKVAVILPAYALAIILFCCASAARSESGEELHTIYFLSLLPYDVPGLLIQPQLVDGPLLFPVAQDAVDMINNSSDILEDYQVELIAANGACDITTITYVSFVSELIHSGKQIVGVVGPGCSDSAVAVSTLCTRSEISLVTVHLGFSPLLADRESFPYAFTNADTTLVSVDAAVALMQYNDWKTVAFLYEVDTLVFAGLVGPFQEKVEKLSGYSIVFSSPVFSPDVPLKELEDSFARIIFIMMSGDSLCDLLCLARHQDLLFPTYQWVSIGNFPECFSAVNVTLQGTRYTCDRDEQLAAMKGLITVFTDLPQYSDDENFFNDIFFDGVWSLGLALNKSVEILEQGNLSLTDYQYGQDQITQVIKEQFYDLDFYGRTGRVNYSRDTGSRFYSAYLSQYNNDLGNSSDLGTMETGEWNVSSNLVVIPDSFPSDYIHVSVIAAAFSFLATGVVTILVLSAHVLTVVYQDYKSVKASSPRLNHFVYIGCYLILVAMVLYAVMETYEISYKAQTAFCNMTIWLLVLGFTLILGPVLVKTWRLYHIFVVGTTRATKSGKVVSDWFLAIVVLLLLSVDTVICLLWTAIDPLVQKTTRDIIIKNGDHMMEVRDTCDSKNHLENIMIPIVAVYKVLLMACSVCLAFLTRRIDMEDFKTKNITLLIYTLTIVCGLGFPIFLLTQTNDDINMNVPFVLLCLVLNSILFLCLALLFFPPLYPLLRKKYYLLSGNPASKTSTYASGSRGLKEQSMKTS